MSSYDGPRNDFRPKSLSRPETNERTKRASYGRKARYPKEYRARYLQRIARQYVTGLRSERRLLAVPNLAPHLSLLSSDLSTTLTRFLDAHQPCAPVIGVSLCKASRHIRQRVGENSKRGQNDQGTCREDDWRARGWLWKREERPIRRVRRDECGGTSVDWSPASGRFDTRRHSHAGGNAEGY